MALKSVYRVALTAGMCGAIAVALLPPAEVQRAKPSSERTPESAERSRLGTELRFARRDWSRLVRRDSARVLVSAAFASGGHTRALVVDPAVSHGMGAAVEQAVESHWRKLGIDSANVRTAVVVFADTAFVDAAYDSNVRGGGEVEFIVPRSGDSGAGEGAACIALVRLGRELLNERDSALVFRRLSEGFRTDFRSRQSLLGPCAFFAAFGAPGPRIAQWLEQRRYQPAQNSDWSRGIQPADQLGQVERMFGQLMGQSDISLTTIEARACLLGDDAACARTILSPIRSSEIDTLGLGVYPVLTWMRAPRAAWLHTEMRFLAEVYRAMGPERFERWWRSADDPASAFEQVMGTSLGDWTRRWAIAYHGATLPGAKVAAPFVLIGALVGCGGAGLAAWLFGRKTVA